jgi:hypothetical protein
MYLNNFRSCIHHLACFSQQGTINSFFVLQNTRTFSGAHPASCWVRTGGSFLGENWPGLMLTSHLHPVAMLRMSVAAVWPSP